MFRKNRRESISQSYRKRVARRRGRKLQLESLEQRNLLTTIAGVGNSTSGDEAAGDICASGDLSCTYTNVGISAFNAMTPAQLRSNYDVLIFEWTNSNTLNADWNTRLLPYLQLGGGVIFEDPGNVGDLAPAAIGNSAGASGITVSASVPGLTDGITNSFVNSHMRFTSWDPNFSPFLTGSSGVIGLYGQFGAGRAVLTGPDNHYHAHSGGGAAGNQYNLLINEIEWVTSGVGIDSLVATSMVNENGTVSVTGSFTDPQALNVHTVTIDWGDGTTSNASVNESNDTFSASHVYVDDGPSPGNNTSQDPYTITATLTSLPPAMTFDGASGSPVSYSEAGMTVTSVYPGSGDHLHLGGNVLNNHSSCCSTPYEFTAGGPFTLVSLDVSGFGGGDSANFVASPGGATVTVTGNGTINFPAAGWTNINSFRWNQFSGSMNIDNVRFASGSGGSSTTTTVTAQTSTIVKNVAPVVSLNSVAAIDENSSATLSGSFVDPGTLDNHTVTINWGDGSPNTVLNLSTGARNFSASHQYLDDDPSVTSSDNYPISVTVADDDTGVGSASTSVTVNNVDPVVSNVAITSPIDENDSATLTGNISDVGTKDTFTLDVDWGDGNAQTFSYPAGTVSFSESHQYLDDDPTVTSSDDYDVTVTLKDDDGGSSSATGGVSGVMTFENSGSSAPSSYTEAGMTVQAQTGEHLHIANFSPDPDKELLSHSGPSTPYDFFLAAGGTFTLISLDVQLQSGTTTLTSSSGAVFTIPSGTGTVTLPSSGWTGITSFRLNTTNRIDIDNVTFGSGSGLTVTVNNVDPVADAGADQTVDEGDLVNLNGSFTDQGTDDGHKEEWTVVASNGESISPLTIDNLAGDSNGSGGSSFSFTPGDNGTYTVTYTVTDDDGGVHSDVSVITVNNVDPEILTLSATSVNEDGTVTLTGTYSDDGSLDTHTIDVDWGPGESADSNVAVSGGSFTITHQYLDDNPTNTASDVYTIAVTLDDDDGGSDTGSTTTTITNVDPVIDTLAATSVDEDGTVHLTGTYSDVGTQDTHELTIDWGEGLPQTVAVSGGSFDITHQYLDDNPTNTPSDIYTIGVTLEDDDTGTDTDSTTTTITNVDPVIDTLAATSVDEDGTVHLTGTYSDVGTQDTHELTIDWGEGLPQTVAVSGGSFDITHQYLDDNPTNTPSDIYTIGVTLEDDDTGTDTDSTTTTITNVDPVIESFIVDSAVINEDGSVTVSGTISDVGTQDTHTVEIDWGGSEGTSAAAVVQSAGSATFTATHQYLDDDPTITATDDYTITATVTDDDSGQDTDSLGITVNNVAPMITDITSGAEECGTAHEDDPITLDLSFDDIGSLDEHTVEIDWGDNETDTIVLNVGDRTLSVDHDYDTGGIYTIIVTLTDDDSGLDSTSLLAVVSGVGLNGLGVLQIIGTAGDDHVTLNQTGNGLLKVHADFIPEDALGETRDFPLGNVERIFMLLCDGDDHATISGRITLDSIIDGGAGDDHLNGGDGSNVILGREGDDHINGGSGRDILIGGLGEDRVIGNPESDVISGGVLQNKSTAATDSIVDEDNLLATQARLRDATDTEIDDWVAGTEDFFADLDLELVDDGGAADQLTGSSADDLFFAFANDDVTDASSNGNGNGGTNKGKGKK